MLTGQRRSEIAGLNGDEIDIDAGVIRLPAERTKNGRPHTVPLSPQALAIINARPRQSAFVFGTGRRSYCSWILPRAALDARLAEAGAALAPWVLHDLRRSVATGLADAGVAPHIVEQILNHQSGHRAGVAGTYNKSRYEAEARAAMVLWQEHLLAVVEDREARVVPLRA